MQFEKSEKLFKTIYQAVYKPLFSWPNFVARPAQGRAREQGKGQEQEQEQEQSPTEHNWIKQRQQALAKNKYTQNTHKPTH